MVMAPLVRVPTRPLAAIALAGPRSGGTPDPTARDLGPSMGDSGGSCTALCSLLPPCEPTRSVEGQPY